MSERLADLDELVLRCKDEHARNCIAEAVACYRAAAFRSSIIATWLAVALDFIHKLQQLDLAGDANAKNRLAQFEKIRESGDIKGSLNFEKALLEMAKNDFELISPLEYDDLKRLFSDRNRCAHPTMYSLDEEYQPTAELARYHIRSAVIHLLQHQPVQGKAALGRLINEIRSNYFPTDPEKAEEHFRLGPLGRPRESLVRNLILILVKDLLTEEVSFFTTTGVQSYSVALQAVRRMHRPATERTLSQSLNDIVRRVSDRKLDRVVTFLHQHQDTWQFLSMDVRGRLERYVQEMSDEQDGPVIIEALDVPELREYVLPGIRSIDGKMLAAMLYFHGGRPEFVERGLELYLGSKDFKEANEAAHDLMVPLIPHLDALHLGRIIEGASLNAEISSSFEFGHLVKRIQVSLRLSDSDLQGLFKKYDLELPALF
jgi:hypothetical protein